MIIAKYNFMNFFFRYTEKVLFFCFWLCYNLSRIEELGHMAKYFKSKNERNLARVEENCQRNVREAENEAREKTEKFMSKIKHYRESTFEELKEEITAKVAAIPSGDIASMDHIINEYAKEQIPQTDKLKGAKLLKERKTFADNLPPEQRRAIYTREIAKVKEEQLRNELSEARRDDILYDLLTDEQVEQFFNLYYAACVKERLERY